MLDLHPIPPNPWQAAPDILDAYTLTPFKNLIRDTTRLFHHSPNTPPQHLVLLGPPASGRSHIAAAIALHAAQNNPLAALLILTGRTGPYPNPVPILDRYESLKETTLPLPKLSPKQINDRTIENAIQDHNDALHNAPPGCIVIDPVETVVAAWSTDILRDFLDTLQQRNVHLLLVSRNNPIPEPISELIGLHRLQVIQIPENATASPDPWDTREPAGIPAPAAQVIAQLCGTRLDFRALLRPLTAIENTETFVDAFLDLFEARLAPRIGRIVDGLAPQQRYIAAALAALPGAISVRDLAEGTGITSQTASRQLYELQNAGIVTKTAVGRESWYEIALPVLRYYFALDGCGPGSVKGILRCLFDWHVPAETRQLTANTPETSVPYYSAALESLDTMIAKNPRNERALWFRAAALAELDRPDEALQAIGRFLETAPAAAAIRRHAAADMLPLFLRRPAHLQKFAAAWVAAPGEIAYAITQWIEQNKPRTREKAIALHTHAATLDAAAKFIPDIAIPVRLLHAAIQRVHDPKNLLLTLPQELRTLLQ